MTSGAILAALLVFAQAPAMGAAPSALEDVRRLYATAAYDEALSRLSVLDARHDADVVDQYRALCLIGLGRVTEADQTLERIVLRSPTFKVSETDASPSFLARFAAVRKRVLPIAATRMYTNAKNTFALKDFASTAAQLHDLLVVLRAESGSSHHVLTNLHQLAEGFLRLTEAELAAASRAVYSALDQDVTPPLEIERSVPEWDPPPQYGWRWFRGVVQVVVDEKGGVESALLVESVADFYDAGLLDAAKTWRFKPAVRSGQPVKYRKLVEITMRPE